MRNYFEFGPVYQEMSFKDSSYLEHWWPFCYRVEMFMQFW